MDNLLDKNPQCVSGVSAGLTPYHNAALFGHLEICKLFLENLHDKNPNTHLGITPLHFAAKTGYFNVCKVILDSVENKNPVANSGQTPLHSAAKGGNLKVIRLLLDNGADKKQLYNGRTPIQIAASYSHYRSSLFLMNTWLDVVIIFKEIWNHRSNVARALLLEMILLFGSAIIMMILSILFQYDTGIEKIDGVIDYIKEFF